MEATPPIPSRVADIKAEIIALGFETDLPGLTEKSELIDLLLRARKSASLNKIPVVLLGEMHEDIQCSLKNSTLLMDVIKPLSKPEFLLVSEGRGINPCYRALKLPSDRIIVEHPSDQSKTEMLDKFLLMADLLMNVLVGRVKQGTGAAAGHGIPDSVTIEPRFFMNKAKHDGFWPLLQAVASGTTLYEQMVTAAFSRNTQFYSLFNGILNHLISSHYLNDVSMSDDIKHMLQSFISTKDPKYLTEIGTLFRLSRDMDVIRQVEERARSENSKLKVIVIIFGAMHYDNLMRLIQKSDVLKVDPKSTNIKFGGNKKKKAQKSKKTHCKTHVAKKRNSKSKKYKPCRR